MKIRNSQELEGTYVTEKFDHGNSEQAEIRSHIYVSTTNQAVTSHLHWNRGHTAPAGFGTSTAYGPFQRDLGGI